MERLDFSSPVSADYGKEVGSADRFAPVRVSKFVRMLFSLS